MAKTVIGLIGDKDEAQKVIDELLQNGFDRKQIGIIKSELMRETDAALTGASRGMVYGGLAGLLVGAVALAVPGIGPALAVGPVLPLLGATFGAITGGLIGGLVSKGVPEEDAHVYAEGLRRGGTLITVNADSDALADRAVEIMKRHGAADMVQLADGWKKQGWSGRFEPSARSAGAGAAATQGAANTASETAAAQRPAVAERTSPMPAKAAAAPMAMSASGTGEAGVDERVVVVSTVEVYDFVLENPEENQARSTGRMHGSAPNQPRYSGPERRSHNVPYAHAERRIAA